MMGRFYKKYGVEFDKLNQELKDVFETLEKEEQKEKEGKRYRRQKKISAMVKKEDKLC